MFLLDMLSLDATLPHAVAPSAYAAPAPASATPAFLAKGDIYGIDISPPMDDWASPRFGMTPARLAALHKAGFNTHREWLELNEIFDPGVDLDARIKQWTDHIAKSVDAGFRVFVAVGLNEKHAAGVVTDTVDRRRFDQTISALCSAMNSRFSSDQVALELGNEPPDETKAPGYYKLFAPKWAALCRAQAPNMTLVFQAESGYRDALKHFNVKDFDENTLFSFHPYTPGEFTHQGIGTQPYFYNIPMPLTRYVGGKEQMIADTVRRINASKTLDEAKKPAEIERYTHFIDYLWTDNGADWQDWSKLNDWVRSTGINPKRIVAGEFGIVSQYNWTGTPSLPDVATRAHYLRGVTSQVREFHYGGWVVHQAMGDFNIFQETGVYDHGDTLIPELVEALFGTDPLPQGPPVKAIGLD